MTSDPTSRRFGLPAGHKFRTAADFQRARAARDRHADALFVVQYGDNDRGEARLGMAVGLRAAGNAVRRNRLRRLIRESFRMHRSQLPAVDMLVTARPAAAAADNATVFASLAALWRRVGGAR